MSSKPILVTGDRPTGRLHLGHLVGSLYNRIKYQHEYECFFLVADLHMLTTHFDKVKEVEENTIQMVLDWLSVGMDPEKSVLIKKVSIAVSFRICGGPQFFRGNIKS